MTREMSKTLVQVDHCPSASKLVLTSSNLKTKVREFKSVIDRADAIEVAAALGWTGPIGEILSLHDRAEISVGSEAGNASK